MQEKTNSWIGSKFVQGLEVVCARLYKNIDLLNELRDACTDEFVVLPCFKGVPQFQHKSSHPALAMI